MARPAPVTVPALPVSRRRGHMFARQVIDPKAFSADTGNTLHLYGEIGEPGLTAIEIIDKLNRISGDVALRINSPGGSVIDGAGIFNALIRHDGKVTAHVDGLAASAASFVAMAADEIIMASNAHMMVHSAWSLVLGPATDHFKEAEVLTKFDDAIARMYAARTGLGVAEVAAMMRNETWFTAEQATANRFADKIDRPSRPSARFDLSVYSNAPAQLTAPLENTQTHTHFHSRTDLEKAMRDRLNLSHAAARKLVTGGYGALAGVPLTAVDDFDSRLADAIAEIQAIRTTNDGYRSAFK